jgi:hypothetical protein
MIENLPGYISITFILTTFLTIGFLFYAVKQTVFDTTPAKILIFLINFWIFFPGDFRARRLLSKYFNRSAAPVPVRSSARAFADNFLFHFRPQKLYRTASAQNSDASSHRSHSGRANFAPAL